MYSLFHCSQHTARASCCEVCVQETFQTRFLWSRLGSRETRLKTVGSRICLTYLPSYIPALSLVIYAASSLLYRHILHLASLLRPLTSIHSYSSTPGTDKSCFQLRPPPRQISQALPFLNAYFSGLSALRQMCCSLSLPR